MAKKFLTFITAAAMLICLAGCSGKYVMTEEDLAVQKSIEGCWLADDSTGYNSYDENGNFLSLTAVRFTEDYKYLLYECMPGDGEASGYVMTYEPVEYSLEEKMFRVDIDGVATYARVSVSEDGQTLFWITDEQTDKYNRLTDEQAKALGIPDYDPAVWTETESQSVDSSEGEDVTASETEGSSETEAESETVSENSAEVDNSDPNN